MFSKIENAIHWVSSKIVYISMITLLIMVFFIGADVLGAYLFHQPVPGSTDIIIIMMIILIFPSFASVTMKDMNVRTDILYDKFSRRGKGICNILNNICIIFLVILMTWQLGIRVLRYIQNPPGNITAFYGWSETPFMIIGVSCLALLFLETTIQLIHSVEDVIQGGHKS